MLANILKSSCTVMKRGSTCEEVNLTCICARGFMSSRRNIKIYLISRPQNLDTMGAFLRILD